MYPLSSVQKIIIDSKQEEIRTSLIKTSNVQIELKNKDRQIEDLQKSLSNQFAYTDDLMDQKNKEVDQLRQGSTTEIRSLENKLKEFEIYMSEKDQMEKERAQLREALEFEKAEKIRELADKERERVQATDKLKNGTEKCNGRYATQDSRDQNQLAVIKERAAINDYETDSLAEPSADERVRVSIEADREVVV